jgi:hypothetical protein
MLSLTLFTTFTKVRYRRPKNQGNNAYRLKGLFGNRVIPNQIVVWSGLDPKKGN